MKPCLVGLLTALAVAASHLQGAPIEWSLTAGGNGHFYEFIPGNITWQQANLDARLRQHLGLNGHLATITSEAERAFTKSQFTSRYWLGGYQNYGSLSFAEPAGGWEWVTGEPFNFTKWNPSEPNDRYDEDFMEVDPASGIGWNDAPNIFSYNTGYLVEYSPALPEPRGRSSLAFSDNFDGTRNTAPGIVASYSGITTTQNVDRYLGIGTGTNAFSGNLLRNQTGMAFPFMDVPQSPTEKTTFRLTGLPEHVAVDINFLFAAIDSWGGTTAHAAPDVFNVVVDGRPILSETFDYQHLSGQTYQPTTGVLLSHGMNLGFSEFPDAAYNLGLDRRFDRIPHTASELTVEFFASGAAWTAAYQGSESWGIDNLEIRLIEPVADYNRNGFVDLADFTLWRNSYGQTGTGLAADGNANGFIDTGDYDLWRAHFGKSLSASTALASFEPQSTTIPDPATLAMLSLAIVLTFCRARAAPLRSLAQS
jgi:hypothetical protein